MGKFEFTNGTPLLPEEGREAAIVTNDFKKNSDGTIDGYGPQNTTSPLEIRGPSNIEVSEKTGKPIPNTIYALRYNITI